MKKGLHALVPSAPACAAVAALIVMVAALLLPPVVGMADNGDFYRVSNGQGIYKLDRYDSDQFFSYASTKFGVYQYFNEYESALVSSQTPFIRAALALDALFTGDDGLFDIRFLGGLLIAYCAAAVYFLVDYLAYNAKRLPGYIIAALCVFIFADTGYTAYFNSFYAEGLVMVSFVFMMAGALLMTQNRYSPYAMMGMFFVNALVLTTSKQQNAPTGVIAGIMLIVLCFVISRKNAAQDQLPTEKPYISKRRRFRAAGFALGTFLCIAGVASYLLIPQEFVNINAYHSMTRGVLMTAEDPEEALAEFGISPQYALLNKSIYYDRNPVIDVESEMLEEDFYSHFNFVGVTLYYLRHPGQLMQMLNLAAKNAWSMRPASLGNYDRAAGFEPGAHTGFFTLYSSFKEKAIPRTIGFIIIFTATLLILGFRNIRRDIVLLFAMLMGLSQFFVSIVGAGDADLSKHIFLFGVSFDLAAVVSICAALVFFTRKALRKRAAPGMPARNAEVRP